MRIRRLSLIPWDIGCQLSDYELGRIDIVLRKVGFRKKSLSIIRDGNALHYCIRINGYSLIVIIFMDGHAQFLIFKKTFIIREPGDFDPDSININKWSFHKELFQNSTIISKFLFEIRKKIWDEVAHLSRRESACEYWESKGVSYVFSFYIIRHKDIKLFQIAKKNVGILLHPKRRPVEESTSQVDDVWTPEMRMMDGQDIATKPLIDTGTHCTWYSWATAVILQQERASQSCKFIDLIATLQKSWFSIFAVNKRLDTISNEIDSAINLNSLIEFDREINLIHFQSGNFKYLTNSMSTETDIELFKGLWRKSKLDDLYQGVCDKSNYLRKEIESLVNEKRENRFKVLEVSVLSLAAIQAISAYIAIRDSQNGITWYEILPFIILISAVGIYMSKGK